MEYIIITVLLFGLALYLWLILAKRSGKKSPVVGQFHSQVDSPGLSQSPSLIGDQTLAQSSAQELAPVQVPLFPAPSLATEALHPLPKPQQEAKANLATSDYMAVPDSQKPPVLPDLEGDLDVDGFNRYSLDKRRYTVVSSTFYRGALVRERSPSLAQ
jgi:hypothetical protein